MFFKVIVIKTIWYSLKNQHIDQWNKTQGPEGKMCICDQFCWESCQEDRTISLINGVEKIKYPYEEDWDEPFASHPIKIKQNGLKF